MIFERFALNGKSRCDRIKERDLTKSFKWISAMLVLSCLQEDRTAWFHLLQRQDLHLVSQRESSVPDVSDNRAAESSASCTLGDLLVGHAEEKAEEFRNFKPLVLSPDVVSRLLSLLEVLGGDWQELRAACSVWKIPRTEQGREVSVETLRIKFRQKVVSMLPPVPLAVLLHRVSEEITGQFSDYADVCVAAMDVDRVANLSTPPGSRKEQSEPDVVRVCATWGVAAREGNRPRSRQQSATELRGACIPFLNKDVATVALQSTEAGISVSESAFMVPEAPVENAPAVVSESTETGLGVSETCIHGSTST